MAKKRQRQTPVNVVEAELDIELQPVTPLSEEEIFAALDKLDEQYPVTLYTLVSRAQGNILASMPVMSGVLLNRLNLMEPDGTVPSNVAAAVKTRYEWRKAFEMDLYPFQSEWMRMRKESEATNV